jgi:hypothetical protein
MSPPIASPHAARDYYDLLSVTSLACVALEKIVTKYGNNFDTQYTNDMQAVIEALSTQHKEASKYASRLTNLPLSMESYNMLRKEEPVTWESVTIPKRHRERAEIYKLKCFNKQHNEIPQQKRQQVPQQEHLTFGF